MKLFFLFFGTILFASNLQAAIIHIPADYSTIQEGIDAAALGDTVLVQPGTYTENIFLFKSLTLASLYLFTQDTTFISQTIIDGDMQGSGILITPSWVGDITIQGFTIQHGIGSGSAWGGGGICYHAGVSSYNNFISLEHLVIRNNHDATYVGGGISLTSETRDSLTYILIRDVVLDSNFDGGGLYCENLDPKLVNVKCKRNSKFGSGGGCFFSHSNPILQNVILQENNAISFGGQEGSGACFYESNPIIQNMLVCENEGAYGALIFNHSNAVLCNVTLTGHEGGGVICEDSQINLSNSIIWENSIVPNESQIDLYGTSSCIISYSNIQNGENAISISGNSSLTWLNGNIQSDPLFLELSDPPFQLSDFSPCIDAGTPDTTGLNLPFDDLLGNQRIWDGDGDGFAIVDIGAYEYNSVPVGTTNPELQSPEFEARSYPNPFSTENTIEFELNGPEVASIQIFSRQGETVYDLGTRFFPLGLNQVTWDAVTLKPGIYFCRIRVGNDMIVKKIIKY